MTSLRGEKNVRAKPHRRQEGTHPDFSLKKKKLYKFIRNTFLKFLYIIL